jgi:hypothetical protein
MPEYVLNEVLKQGFEQPSPIQSQGWPMALKGRNMVGVSATGTWKNGMLDSLRLQLLTHEIILFCAYRIWKDAGLSFAGDDSHQRSGTYPIGFPSSSPCTAALSHFVDLES